MIYCAMSNMGFFRYHIRWSLIYDSRYGNVFQCSGSTVESFFVTTYRLTQPRVELPSCGRTAFSWFLLWLLILSTTSTYIVLLCDEFYTSLSTWVVLDDWWYRLSSMHIRRLDFRNGSPLGLEKMLQDRKSTLATLVYLWYFSAWDVSVLRPMTLPW